MIQPLRTSSDFRALRATGRRVSEGPITMIAAASDEATSTRIAYAIPRRVGTAVRRNRLRRQLREVFRGFDQAGSLPISRYLVICDPSATKLDYVGLTTSVQTALQRVSSFT